MTLAFRDHPVADRLEPAGRPEFLATNTECSPPLVPTPASPRARGSTNGLRDGRVVFGCVYAALCILGILIPAKVWGVERADVCMVVGLDVSGSINNDELRLQYDGLAAALVDRRFIHAVETGHHGLIAVAVYTWADSHDSVQVVVPWTGVQTDKDARTIAEILTSQGIHRAVQSTSLTVALQAGTELLQACPWFADRQLLNVAGDGHTNIGPAPLRARNAAIDRGIIVNGLVVGDDSYAVEHYTSQVVGPANIGFLVTVGDYQDFAQAMLNKFMLEISWLEDVPYDSC